MAFPLIGLLKLEDATSNNDKHSTASLPHVHHAVQQQPSLRAHH
jgi:hypothetical protein